MFRNMCIYSNTHSLTRSQVSTITQMSHKHPVFEDQISSKKMPKSHANTNDRHALQKTWNRLRRRPARLPQWSDCSKSVHNHFFKNLYWTRLQLVTYCSLHSKQAPWTKTKNQNSLTKIFKQICLYIHIYSYKNERVLCSVSLLFAFLSESVYTSYSKFTDRSAIVPGALWSRYYCSPFVCVLNFLGGLVVWRF